MSEKLEELISLLYQDRLTQCGKRLLVENIEKLQKENETLKNFVSGTVNENIEKDFIPVQEVKDKIEELEKNLYTVEHYETVGAINVLQELLEGRK